MLDFINMWRKLNKSEMFLQPMTSYSWCKKDKMFHVEWDSETNISTMYALSLRVANSPLAVLQTSAVVRGKETAATLDVNALIVPTYHRDNPTILVRIRNLGI